MVTGTGNCIGVKRERAAANSVKSGFDQTCGRLHHASADHPIADAVTLTHGPRQDCEPVHQRHRNQTFCDGNHINEADDEKAG
jgi:hypothetical protein